MNKEFISFQKCLFLMVLMFVIPLNLCLFIINLLLSNPLVIILIPLVGLIMGIVSVSLSISNGILEEFKE